MNLKQAVKIANKILVQNKPVQMPSVIVDGECICGDRDSRFILVISFEKNLDDQQNQMSEIIDLQPLVLYQHE